jgi:hypothetical protein
MGKMNRPEKLDFKLETSFSDLGEFIFKEVQPERQRFREVKQTKEPPSIYVFPKSTAAIAEL